MKFLISVFIVAIIFSLTEGSKWEDKAKLVRERYEKIKKTCAEKNNFTATELEDYESRMSPENKKERCMLACILTQAGIMADGTFSRSGSDELTSYLYDDSPELQAKSREISKRCEKLVQEAKLTDECDIAQEVFLCVRKTSKQLGFKD